MTSASQAPRSRPLVVSVLGLTQIMAWGTSYYLLAVLAVPISRDMGWSLGWVVGGMSCALVAAGLVSPVVGRMVQEHGGRPVLATSSLLLAGGLAGVGLATSLPAYLAAWTLVGAGMGAGLYDAAFATLGSLYGRSARAAIVTLTLFGGFASTACWPLSALLLDHVGWRNTCLIYAAVQLLVSLPLHLAIIPASPAPALLTPAASDAPTLTGTRQRSALLLLGVIVTLVATGATMMSVHLLTLLQAQGISLAVAVGFGAMIGPAQVGGRVVEMLFGRHYHPIWTMLASVTLIGIGLLVLLAGTPLTAMGLIVYGAGNGIHSIARGALPLALFDARAYAGIMGRLARPKQFAEAAAPAVGAYLLQHGGPSWLLGLLVGLAGVALGCATALWRVARSGDRPVH